MAKSELVDGLLVIDKPAGWTSSDVVGKCRRIVGQRRIGHAGTLDPSATGVLLVALGRATRLMRFLHDLPKSYTGEVVLGVTTSTLDADGEVTGNYDMSEVTFADVQAAASKFVGNILQIPPMVSAVQIGGKRLHVLARAGIEVERQPRPVTVHSLEVEGTDEAHVFRLSVQCSSGTYVRTLAADLGEALGGGAHLRNLRRTAIGSFSLEDAVSLEMLEEMWPQPLLPSGAMVRHLSHVCVSAAAAEDIRHGRRIDRRQLGFDGNGPWAAVDEQSNLLAVYELKDGRFGAGVVLAGD